MCNLCFGVCLWAYGHNTINTLKSAVVSCSGSKCLICFSFELQQLSANSLTVCMLAYIQPLTLILHFDVPVAGHLDMGAGVGLSCVGHFHDLRTSVRELSAMGFVVCLMSEQCECWVLFI